MKSHLNMVPPLKPLESCLSEEAFKPFLAGRYNDLIEELFLQIYTLNWNTFILGKIKDTSSALGKMILEDAYQVAVMIIYKLAFDQTGAMTLRKFRDLIRKNLKHEQHRNEFDSKLKLLKFDRQMKSLESLFREERNERIGHIFGDSFGTFFITHEKSKRRDKILKNLKKATTLINQFYDVLKLGRYRTHDLVRDITTNNQASKLLDQLS